MAGKTKGLGKGLASLLGEVEMTPSDTEKELQNGNLQEQTVKIRMIEPNRDQPRKDFPEEELQELAESIRVHGVITPLIVVKRDEHYMIIAGERRWRAAKLAGLREVPVIVREYSEREIAEVALIENLQRSDLNPIEEAMAYDRLIREYNLTQEELSESLSKSRAAIANSLRLLKLPENVRKLLEMRLLSQGHAKVILGLESAELQSEAAEQVVKDNLSVRDTEKLIQQYGKAKKSPNVLENGAEYRKTEEELAEKLKTRVRIDRKTEKSGKIVIEYSSVEDMERILSHIR